MAHNLQVNVDLLENLSKAWLDGVAPDLKNVAASINDLKYTRVEFGPLFQFTWDAYSDAAAYIQHRLEEAVPAAQQIGDSLHTAASSFREQQTDQEHKLKRLEYEVDNFDGN